MRPTHNNYRQSTQKVKSNFALCVQKLFTAELHGYKINNKVIIKILVAALCCCESLFAVCRSIAGSPTDKTIADNLIKLLPPYQKLQQQINTTLASGLPKKFFRKPIGLPLTSSSFPITVDTIKTKMKCTVRNPRAGLHTFTLMQRLALSNTDNVIPLR
jgi:hypothetical protein